MPLFGNCVISRSRADGKWGTLSVLSQCLKYLNINNKCSESIGTHCMALKIMWRNSCQMFFLLLLFLKEKSSIPNTENRCKRCCCIWWFPGCWPLRQLWGLLSQKEQSLKTTVVKNVLCGVKMLESSK